jgi:hypothetical protein
MYVLAYPPIPPSLPSRNLKKSRVSETRLRQNVDFWPQKMVSHSTVAKGYDLVETKAPATLKIGDLLRRLVAS